MKAKSVAFTLFTILATTLFFPYTSHAHVLKTDSDIGAVFHVTPDDDPIAGQESEFFFEIKDKTNRFSPEQCDCQASIQQNNQTIFSQTLFHSQHSSNLSSGGFTYTFPEKSLYKVIVTGKPLDGTSFQPFTLIYDLRVDRQIQNNNSQTTQTDQSSTPLAYILLPIILVLFLVIALFGKKKNNSPKSPLMIIIGLIISTIILNSRPLLLQELAHHDQVAIHHEQSHPCCITQSITTTFGVDLQPNLSYINTHTSKPQKIYHSAIKSLTRNKSPPVA